MPNMPNTPMNCELDWSMQQRAQDGQTLDCKKGDCTPWVKSDIYSCFVFIRLTPLSRPNKVGLKCPSACPSVRPFTKRFFNFSEISYVGKGRRVTHDGMQCDPIQGQDQGHEPLKVGHFQRLSLLPFIMGAGK